MSLPKFVKILGKRWAVEVRDKLPGNDYGQCQEGDCLILIRAKQAADQMRDTVLHEVMHAIDHELQTGLREKQVRLQATGLLSFLRANPEVTAWLLSDEPLHKVKLAEPK